MKRWLTILSFLCLSMFAGNRGEARNIYLNGQKINSVRNQTFYNVTVKIDQNGDIYIIGKQYRVIVKKPGSKQKPSKETNAANNPTKNSAQKTAPLQIPPKNKYILFVQRTPRYGSGYRLIVYINGRKVTTTTIDTPQDVLPITKYLRKGENKVVIEAIKMKPNAPGEVVLIIAKGEIKGGKVAVHPPYLLQYKRTGSETQNFKHIFTLKAD